MTTAILEAPAPLAELQPADHAHHWVIEEANGPMSAGVCKRCGVSKAFKNWLEATDFVTNEERRSAA